MSVFNLAARNITANAELDTASAVEPAAIQGATVTLVDPTTQWPLAEDNTRHILVWGIQIDNGDGTGFRWFLFQGDPTTSAVPVPGGYSGPTGSAVWVPFGQRAKDGSMPRLQASSSQVLEAANSSVRLGILTDANIRLGAQIVTS